MNPVPIDADLAGAVLRRIEADMPGLAGWPGSVEAESWRGRAADEAALLVELLRMPDEGGPSADVSADPADADDSALVAHLLRMAARGVPQRLVQRFVRAAAAAAFAELWHRAGPGDATALLRVSRLLAGRRDTAERVLLEAYGATPAPASPTLEVV